MFMKNLHKGIMLASLVIFIAITYSWFETPVPTFKFGFESVVIPPSYEAQYLFHHLFGGLYNSIINNDFISSNIRIVTQYGLAVLLLTLFFLSDKKDDEFEIKRGASREDPEMLRLILLKEIYLKK